MQKVQNHVFSLRGLFREYILFLTLGAEYWLSVVFYFMADFYVKQEKSEASSKVSFFFFP